jgi:hypothetical protein
LAVSLANGRSSTPPTPPTAAPNCPKPAPPLLLLLLLLSADFELTAAGLAPVPLVPADSFVVVDGDPGLLLLLLLRGGFTAWLALLPGLLPLLLLLLLGASDVMLAIKLLPLRPRLALGMLLMLACVMRSMRISWSSE